MQDKITAQIEVMKPLKGWNISTFWNNPKE
jgi:hypothetical protein